MTDFLFQLYKVLFGVSIEDSDNDIRLHHRTRRDATKHGEDKLDPEETNSIPKMEKIKDGSIKRQDRPSPTKFFKRAEIDKAIKTRVDDLSDVLQQMDGLKNQLSYKDFRNVNPLLSSNEMLDGIPTSLPPNLKDGLIYETLVDHPEFLADPNVRDVIEKVLGLKKGVKAVQPTEVVWVLRVSSGHVTAMLPWKLIIDLLFIMFRGLIKSLMSNDQGSGNGFFLGGAKMLICIVIAKI